MNHGVNKVFSFKTRHSAIKFVPTNSSQNPLIVECTVDCSQGKQISIVYQVLYYIVTPNESPLPPPFRGDPRLRSPLLMSVSDPSSFCSKITQAPKSAIFTCVECSSRAGGRDFPHSALHSLPPRQSLQKCFNSVSILWTHRFE